MVLRTEPGKMAGRAREPKRFRPEVPFSLKLEVRAGCFTDENRRALSPIEVAELRQGALSSTQRIQKMVFR
jgi:hypothetical protein